MLNLSKLGPVLRALPNKGKARWLGPLVEGAGLVETKLHGYRMRLDLNDYVQRGTFLGCYEYAEIETCKSLLKRGGAVLDVGANCGCYTAMFCRAVGEKGLVIAIEPSPRMQARLREFKAGNPVPQLELLEAGLSESESMLDLYVPPEGSGNDDAVMTEIPGYQPIQVPVTTLDALLAKHQGIFKLLKIDVEGHEPKILRGGRTVLASGRVEFLLIEFNSYFLSVGGGSADSLFELILELGFAPCQEKPRFAEKGLETLLFRHRSFVDEPVLSQAGNR